MLKAFNVLFIYALTLSCVLKSFAQEEPRFREVLLNGKPAKLNVETGEVTILNNKTNQDQGINEKELDSVRHSIPVVLHKVGQEETLLDISKQYKVSLNALKQLNGLETTLVKEGQVIRVSGDFIEKPKGFNGNSSKKPVELNDKSMHIVQKGETLYSISKKYGLTVNELKTFNSLNSNLIRTGQSLHLQLQTQDLTVDSIIIKEGDTLYSIAKRFNTTVSVLKELNGLSNSLIKRGQKLRIK